MSQKPRELRVVPRMTIVREQEEFEWDVVGEDLIARHTMKVGAGAAFDGCLRAFGVALHGVFETRLGLRLGRPPHELRAARVATPEELAAMRGAA